MSVGKMVFGQMTRSDAGNMIFIPLTSHPGISDQRHFKSPQGKTILAVQVMMHINTLMDSSETSIYTNEDWLVCGILKGE
jgi:hypothetical protein